MDIKLKNKNSASDFKDKVNKMTNEIQEKYDCCDAQIQKAENISNSILGAINSVTKNISTSINLYNQKSNTTEIIGTNSRTVDFKQDSSNNYELKDRYDEDLSIDCISNIVSGNLQLPSTLTQSAISHGGVNNAVCSIEEQAGSNLYVIDTMTDVSNMIDMSTTTYCYNEIITENRFLPQYTKNNYYLNEGGAFFEVKVSLESVRRINSITITPFSKYPLQLVYIKYTQTDNEHDEKMNFGSSDIPYSEESIYLGNESISINFDTAIVKNVFIGFNQAHYEFCTTTISKSDLDTNDIKYNKNLSNEYKVISGYKYEYGIANINLEYNDYSSTGIYETDEINSISTISKIRIEDNCTHPRISSDDNEIYTDNEYYISLVSDPTFKDWIGIVPININKIECERLFDFGGTCTFRFLAKEVFVIKESGRILEEREYVLKTDGEYFYGVNIPNFNPTMIYSVSYTPIDSSKEININHLSSALTKNQEIIYCNGANSYELKAYPHLPYNDAVDVEVLDTNKNKIYKQSENKITNTTNKNEFVFNKDKFQYYIDANRVFFNRDMDSRYTVKITYNTLSSMYKLKVIMRRNTNSNREITQTIKKIKVITDNI